MVESRNSSWRFVKMLSSVVIGISAILLMHYYLPYPSSIVTGIVLTVLPGYLLTLILLRRTFTNSSRSDPIVIFLHLASSTFVLAMLINSIPLRLFFFFSNYANVRTYVVFLNLVIGLCYVICRQMDFATGLQRPLSFLWNAIRWRKPARSSILAAGFIAAIFVITAFLNLKYMTIDEGHFLVRDVSAEVALMRSIGKGDLRDLLDGGQGYASPSILTFTFVFWGVLVANIQLQTEVVLFVTIMNSVSISLLLSVVYLFLTRVRTLSTLSTFLTLSLITFAADASSIIDLFGLYDAVAYVGLRMPSMFPGIELPVAYPGPSLGFDALLTGFHHLPILISIGYALYVSTLFAKSGGYKQATFVLVSLVALSAGFHLGIGAPFLAGAILASFLAFMLASRLIQNKLRIVAIEKLVVTLVIIVVYPLLSFNPFFFERLGFVVVPKAMLLVDSIIAIILLNTWAIPMIVIAYVFLKADWLSIQQFLIITVIDIELVVLLLFSVYHNSNLGSLLAYSTISFQFAAALFIGLALNRIAGDERPEKPKTYVPYSSRSMRRFKVNPKMSKAAALVLVIFVSGLFTLNMSFAWQSDYHAFYRQYYGSLPIISEGEDDTYRWIIHNSDPNSIFLTHPKDWELAAITGRFVMSADYRGAGTQIYDDNLEVLYTNDTGRAIQLIHEYNVTHLYLNNLDSQVYNTSKFYLANQFFELKYQNGNMIVFAVI